jgi:hypothetical protein
MAASSACLRNFLLQSSNNVSFPWIDLIGK